MAETPEVTPVSEWVVPNQDKLEQVIDARLAKHSESKPSRSTSRSASNADKEKDQAEKPKS